MSQTSMITYRQDDIDVLVYLDGQRVGTIRRVKGGWRYWPKGNSTPGEVLPTVQAVKRSLQGDDESGAA